MLRTTAWVVMVLAMIALGIGLKQGLFGDTNQTAQNETKLPVSAPAPAGSNMESVTPVLKLPHSSDGAILAQPQASSSAMMNSSGHEPIDPTAASQPRNSSESLTSIDSETSGPDVVIGRPFSVSASVESLCRSHGKNAPCSEVLQLLSEMAQQPRDLAWAPEMEAKLRALIMAEANQFSIRAIECRTSLCGVEVASIFGVYLGNLDADKSLKKSLMTWFGTTGYETNPSSARVTVTLLTFKRR